jgi:hypothetical protein
MVENDGGLYMTSYLVSARSDLSEQEAVSALDVFRGASVKGLNIVQDISSVLVVSIENQDAMNEAIRISGGRLTFEEERTNFTQDPSP